MDVQKNLLLTDCSSSCKCCNTSEVEALRVVQGKQGSFKHVFNLTGNFHDDDGKVRMIYLERVWDRYCLIFFMILITSTCSQIQLSFDIYKRLSNAN